MGIDRSENMRRVRSRDTLPELTVRHALRRLGHVGYRLHRSDLPGHPDVVFIGMKKAIFVHGCFWHGHDCTEGTRVPKTNVDYWLQKIQRNRERDRLNESLLTSDGWSVLTLWECELRDDASLLSCLDEFMSG
jgi:DNA mismatch endonuclease (patch repair protein)